MKPLSELLAALPQHQILRFHETAITGVTADSRQVMLGSLFVAIRGVDADGHRFIPDALRRGAAAIVLTDPVQTPAAVPVVAVPDAREALAWMSAAFHDYPARHLRIVGVTGTDGKTTTINLIHSILGAAGRKAGLISTVNALIGDAAYDTGLHTTTPDAPDVQRYLAEMLAAGCEYALLEATSHGLAQHRVTACEFDVAVMTNITHDHLDFHRTVDEYRTAKARLFWHLSGSARKPGLDKVAVLNADDAAFAFLREIPADRRLVYSLAPGADLWPRDVRASNEGLEFTAATPLGDIPIRSPLIGAYNVSNILAAVAASVSQNTPPAAIAKGVAAMKGIPGRMERIDEGQPFTAIVDFAHTPNALRRALETLRPLTPGRLMVVFGCAGLRDPLKRPLMGQAAGELADLTVITAEDPRTENLGVIMDQVAAGCEGVGRHEGRDYWRIGDRGQAIRFAVGIARPGDTVVVAGKGHEQSMCFGTVETPWDDRVEVRQALVERDRSPPAG